LCYANLLEAIEGKVRKGFEMKHVHLYFLLGGLALLGLLISACSTTLTTGSSDADVLLTAEAANPLPTELSSQGLSVVKTKACQVEKLVSVQVQSNDVQVDTVQGDLIAWSPMGDEFAYVTPDNEKWGWFVGNLVVLDVKTQKAIFTSQNQEVNGDLTWSPDGSLLAYVVLDPKTKVYTVDIVNLSNGSTQDIFTSISPQTDSWSSTKGIDRWSNSQTLLVTSSCDVDCSRSYSYDVASGQLTAGAETRKSDDHTLNVTNQDASPNTRWEIAVDTNNDNVWLASSINGQASIILAGVTAYEIKWSTDSSYVALRTDDSVLVYEPICSK